MEIDPEYLPTVSDGLAMTFEMPVLEPSFFDQHVEEIINIIQIKLMPLVPQRLPGLRGEVIKEDIINIVKSKKWQLPIKSCWVETNEYDLYYYCANIFWPEVCNRNILLMSKHYPKPVLPDHKCKHCGKLFETSLTLIMHTKEFHEEDVVLQKNHVDPDFWGFTLCLYCGKLCLTPLYLKSHQIEKHNDKIQAKVSLSERMRDLKRLNEVTSPLSAVVSDKLNSDPVTDVFLRETKSESKQKTKKKNRHKCAKSEPNIKSEETVKLKQLSKPRIHSYQTEGNPDDYDLEKVLEALGETKIQSKPKKHKNKTKIKHEEKESISNLEEHLNLSSKDHKVKHIDKCEALDDEKQAKINDEDFITALPLENVREHVQPEQSKEQDFKPIQEYIDSIEAENRSLKVSQQFYNSMEEDYHKLKKKLECIDETRLCKICLEKDTCMVFIPCGHFMSCADCSLNCKNCAMCRKPIQSAIKTYFS